MPPMLLFCLTNTEGISAQIKNKYGDRGSPCLVPLFTSKHPEYWPFTYMHDLYLHKKWKSIFWSFQKLNAVKDFSVKDQATLSKAFSKSVIKRRPGMRCLLAYSSVSYNSRMFCLIYLPFRKPLWSSCISCGRTVFTLFAIQDDAILHTVFNNVIGLQFKKKSYPFPL